MLSSNKAYRVVRKVREGLRRVEEEETQDQNIFILLKMLKKYIKMSYPFEKYYLL